MTFDMTRQEMMRDFLLNSGPEGFLALVILIGGLFLTNRAVRLLRTWLSRFLPVKIVSITCILITLVAFMVVIALASVQLHLPPRPILRVILIGCFVVLGVVLLAGPFLPSLPFKTGQLVKLGDHFGIVETITLLNTRIRTFDGKVIYTPNARILKDEIINYHHTDTRRVKVDIRIGLSEDLVRVKQIMEELMIADARVQIKPSPAVFVLEIGDSGVKLGARCWVKNADFWFTRCDLTEKIKVRFDHEQIAFAYNQMDVHLHSPYAAPIVRGKGGCIDPAEEEHPHANDLMKGGHTT
jgi:small conductance mechanosensitive channel